MILNKVENRNFVKALQTYVQCPVKIRGTRLEISGNDLQRKSETEVKQDLTEVYSERPSYEELNNSISLDSAP